MAAIEHQQMDTAQASASKEFNETTVSWIVYEKQDLVFATEETTIAQGLELLGKRNITSLPIMSKDHKPLGIVSIFDVTSFIAFGIFDNGVLNKAKLEEKMNHPISGLIGGHEEGKNLWIYGGDTPLSKVTEPMSKGVHRALVLQRVDEQNQPIYRIITQTDVVRHFLHYGECYPDVKKSLEDLNLASAAGTFVNTMKATDTTLHGLTIMQQKDVAALPVVDENGSIITTLSASDLRGLTKAEVENLSLPVLEYLKGRRNGRLTVPVTCFPTDNLFLMMMKALAAQVHRLWVVDSKNTPIGVVSLSDMINILRGLDEDLHSRQLAVYGRQAMRQLSVTRVLISGMNGLGAEIAKNVILAGVRAVVLHDTETVRPGDLGAHFYLSEEDIGKNRAVACLKKMRELNPSVKVDAVESELNTKLISQNTVFVYVGGELEKAVEFDNFCRTHSPVIPFIKADVNGLFGSMFSDFGDTFVCTDTTGENPESYIISEMKEDGKILVVDEEQISFGDGSWVTFTEVEGIPELNDGVPRKVTDQHPFSFKVEDADFQWKNYITGGLVHEVKMPKEIHFRPLSECLKSPGMMEPTDFSKFGRDNMIILLLRALDLFRSKHGGEFPKPCNENDLDEVYQIARELNANAADEDKVDDVDERIVKALASGSRACLNPLAATYGGIAGQEVIKAATGKFHPCHQWLIMDFAEALPNEALTEEDVKPEGNRYDDQVAVFGRKFQEKLGNQKYFLVGAGALGCEFLKNFAMCGICCGPEGKLFVTDDDVIEKSNLSRQFLFRNWHIHKYKADVASSEAQKMNPALNVEAVKLRVQPSTENHFNDDFWNSLNGVCNALDNIKARLYIDTRCVFFEKPLLESGTLGPKCHTQVVLPHKTAHYGAERDPPEKNPPACTLHNFPHNIDHCLQVGRSEFVGHFEVAPDEFMKFYHNDDYIQKLQESNVSKKEICEKLKAAASVAEFPTRTFEDCVKWARMQFEEYFYKRIATLIHMFPKDAKTKEGTMFWAPPKRFPTPIVFDSSDPLHMQFIIAASNLRANICGIEVDTKDLKNRNPDFFLPILANIEIPKFQATDDEQVKKQVAEAEAGENSSDSGFDDLDSMVSKMPKKDDVAFMKLTPEDFEKDDDYNHHMDFVGAVGNLRARNYGIQEVDKLKAKLIAGRIIPAIATATAMATGLVMMELFKIVNEKKVGASFCECGDYRNSSNNLALSRVSFFDPNPPAKAEDRTEITRPDPNHPEYEEEERIKVYPPGYTIWDKIIIEFDPKTATVQDISDIFKKEHNIKLEALTFHSGDKLILLYNSVMPSHKERLPMVFSALYNEKLGAEYPFDAAYTIPDCTFMPIGSDEDSLHTPMVIFRHKK